LINRLELGPECWYGMTAQWYHIVQYVGKVGIDRQTSWLVCATVKRNQHVRMRNMRRHERWSRAPSIARQRCHVPGKRGIRSGSSIKQRRHVIHGDQSHDFTSNSLNRSRNIIVTYGLSKMGRIALVRCTKSVGQPFNAAIVVFDPCHIVNMAKGYWIAIHGCGQLSRYLISWAPIDTELWTLVENFLRPDTVRQR